MKKEEIKFILIGIIIVICISYLSNKKAEINAENYVNDLARQASEIEPCVEYGKSNDEFKNRELMTECLRIYLQNKK